MHNATTTKVPSPALADRLAALANEGTALAAPFLEFASKARLALREFDTEVEAARLNEEQLQEAAAPIGPLHDAIYEMSDGFLDMLIALGATDVVRHPEAA
jgi:hypothetical protein